MANSKTYELMLKIGGKADSSLKKACETADKNLGAVGETVAKLGNTAKAAAKVAVAGIAAAATATVAAGTAAYNLGSKFDDAYDTIRIGTGATGEALEELKGSMKAVYSSVPAEMTDAAQAIADYNTRLGVTGDVLETLSTQAIQTSQMLNDDLTTVIETSSKAFQQWDIAEESMAGAMDYIFKVSQSTGVGFSTLMSEMQSYGAQLQSCGYDFENAATLLGQVEKSGYDASTVFTALKTAAKTAADEGFASINEGLQSYINQVQNAGSETEAYNIAVDVFGSRAASTMVEAIQNGTLAIGSMTAELLTSSETISTAAEDTYDLAEKWQMLKNRLSVALEPTASAVFETINNVAESIMPKLEAQLPKIASGLAELMPKLLEIGSYITEKIGSAAEHVWSWFQENKSTITSIVGGIGITIKGVAEEAMPLVQAGLGVLGEKLPEIGAYITGTIIPAAKDIWNWVQKNQTVVRALAAGIGTAVVAFKGLSSISSAVKVLQTFGGVGKAVSGVFGLLNVKMLLIAAAIGAVVAAGVWLYQNWDTVKAKAAELGTKISEVWGNVKTWVLDAVGNVVAAFQENFPLLSAYISGWWQSIQDAWVNVKGIFTGIIDFVQNVFSGDWDAAWQSIVDIFGNVFGLIVNLAKAPINGVISAINWVLEKINAISITIPDWVPGAGGQTLGFNIPTIPALAVGGIATAPTLAEIGEGGEPEAVLPLSKLAGMLESGGFGGGGGITFAPVIQIQGSASRQDVEEATKASFEEFKRMWQRMQSEERRKSFRYA